MPTYGQTYQLSCCLPPRSTTHMIDPSGENSPFAKNHGIDYLFRKNLHSMDGIQGKIKTIYEDFHVHEITKHNIILHLEQLIHREKINQIILQNEEDEREKLITSISQTELHIRELAKYVNKHNVKTFRRFLTLLQDIYQLKVKSEAGELPRDDVKKVSTPYCLFVHLDEMPSQEESHVDENGGAIPGEEPPCSDGLPPEEPSDGNKAARRNIHNVIKQYYPFLLTETKSVPQGQSVLSHGNILQGNANCENNSAEFVSEKGASTHIGEEKAATHISAIQIYPSLNCLKTILPQDIFNKLKGNAKKSRFSQNDELENIICQKLDQMEEKKKITKLPEQGRQFYREEFAPEDSDTATGFFENKKRKIECGTLSQSFDDDCPGGGNKKGRGEKEVEAAGEAEGGATTANLRENPPRDDARDKAKGGDPPKETTPTWEEEGVPPTGVSKNVNAGHTDCNQLSHEELSENVAEGNFLHKLNDHRKKKSEQKKGKKYLHFNLYKENKDICEVLHKIKINLKKKNGDISYCGIKDKRGITVQRFCIHKARKVDLFRLIMGGDCDGRDRGRSGHRSDGRSGHRNDGRGRATPWCNNVYVSNLSYAKRKLSLGDLKGNFFKVLIRGVEDSSEEKFCVLTDNFRKAGFVNYFGHQRFGSKQIKNYEIGICILKKNYKQALFHVVENAGLDSSKKARLVEYLNEVEGGRLVVDEGGATHQVEDKRGAANRVVDNGGATHQVVNKAEAVVPATPNDESHAWKDEKDGQAEGSQNDLQQKGGPTAHLQNDLQQEGGPTAHLQNDAHQKGDPTAHLQNDAHQKGDPTAHLQNDAHQKGGPTAHLQNGALPPQNSAKQPFFKKKKEKKTNATPRSNAKEEQNKLPKDISEILNSISSHSHVEKTILCSLKNDKNFKNAFMNLPKDIFSLFIHSAQSLIFNILADIRMKKYGFSVVVGDLIESTRNNDEVPTSDSSTEHHSDESEGDEPPYETNVIIVTHENISSYNIYDVVLPLPGDKNFLFPPNLIDQYKSVLSSLHLSLDDFRSEKNFFSAPGGYRKVVVKPRDVKSLFIKSGAAGEGRIPFIRSDLSRLMEGEGRGANSAARSEGPKGDAANLAAKSEGPKGDAANLAEEIQRHITFVRSDAYHEYLVKEVPNYRTTASVLLTCSLPKSSYITVALLEVLNG
ncbi:hypothetical protein, conserved [Plasmodium vivax]|uniref:TRUD domain-containing protein n=1 Tax=Plasmodium vivax (strain Salvador I) TaxID=126793 RepID=A5KDV0_PLAVS|nr:hypothetical protein, conserved [Plasmodium vivax]EDL42396.1 hypothetical protein, conserved [Plasmodium vivax]|eukprot:XP_001608420.1 hypothetical protein [Plasmodium vivax Sal-1]